MNRPVLKIFLKAVSMRSKLIAYFIILTAHHVVTRYEVIAGQQFNVIY